jgi:hypothetical protein
MAAIRDNSIDLFFETVDLTQKDLPPEKSQLSGTAFKLSNPDTAHKIAGFVWFHGGNKLAQLAKPNAVDSVTLTDGTKIAGKIRSVSRNEMQLTTMDGNTKTIAVSQIADVSSPVVFRVQLADGSANMKFSSTYQGAAKAAAISSGSAVAPSEFKGKKIAIALIAGALIATAIAVPIAVPLAARGRGGRNGYNDLANALLIQQAMRPAPPPLQVQEPPPELF